MKKHSKYLLKSCFSVLFIIFLSANSIFFDFACPVSISTSPVFAGVTAQKIEYSIQKTGEYILSKVKSPKIASTGGEWAIIGLSRSGHLVSDDYLKSYYRHVEDYLKQNKGILHERKYTEYSRVILALTAIGANPQNIAGYNLLLPLADYEKTSWQGINGPIWALIALDSKDYEIPLNKKAKVQATRDMYIGRILESQLSDGGWSLLGDKKKIVISDPDITAMALQALAKYTERSDVKISVDKALNYLSKVQKENGGYSAQGGSDSSNSEVTNLETSAQVLVALLELGIDMEDEHFVKNGNTLLDHILTFYKSDGSFTHVYSGSGSNQMATEQGYYTLAAVYRASTGKNSLYRMGDVPDNPLFVGDSAGVSGGDNTASSSDLNDPSVIKSSQKHPDVQILPIVNASISFSDIEFHKNKKAIEAMASRNIVSGVGDGKFSPDKKMTRAEFAVIVVRSLGLKPQKTAIFNDVPANSWYSGYVGAAYKYGIVRGTTPTTFSPSDYITREQATVMVMQAAKLCGLERKVRVRDELAQFGDYTSTSSWAREGLAFCYAERILDPNDLNIEPSKLVLRADVAQMLYNMLFRAGMIE